MGTNLFLFAQMSIAGQKRVVESFLSKTSFFRKSPYRLPPAPSQL